MRFLINKENEIDYGDKVGKVSKKIKSKSKNTSSISTTSTTEKESFLNKQVFNEYNKLKIQR
jgi:hypothetical protein